MIAADMRRAPDPGGWRGVVARQIRAEADLQALIEQRQADHGLGRERAALEVRCTPQGRALVKLAEA